MNEAVRENWSSRTLDRNIGTQYYYRLLQSPKKELIIQEMLQKTSYLQNPNELIKNPVIAEFLGYKTEDAFLESELESSMSSGLNTGSEITTSTGVKLKSFAR